MFNRGQPQLNTKPLLAGILVALGLGVLAILLATSWPVLFPSSIYDAEMASNCDLNAGPCMAQFGDGALITLAVMSKDPVANEPLRLTVEVEGFTPKRIDVLLRAKSTTMKQLKVPLVNVGQSIFAGDTTLPARADKELTWLVQATSDETDGQYNAAFEFVLPGTR